MISNFGDVVELNDGSFLVKNYGKYTSGLGIIIDKDDDEAVIRNGVETDHISLFRTHFEGSQFNLGNMCSLSGIVGDFFVSKKGTKLFKKNKNGKHILLRDDWGGAFNSYYGGTLPEVQEGALYYRRASSNGGGSGYDYAIIPKEWKRTIRIEDL
jgi:hypothetical protein